LRTRLEVQHDKGGEDVKSLLDCKYSAFVSYAHADDEATDGWISQFSELLRTRLQNRLGRIGVKQLQQMHLSGRNGPVIGSLPDALLDNVANSYAMIIVVFNAYTKLNTSSVPSAPRGSGSACTWWRCRRARWATSWPARTGPA
jgi:hypothetical protein